MTRTLSSPHTRACYICVLTKCYLLIFLTFLYSRSIFSVLVWISVKRYDTKYLNAADLFLFDRKRSIVIVIRRIIFRECVFMEFKRLLHRSNVFNIYFGTIKFSTKKSTTVLFVVNHTDCIKNRFELLLKVEFKIKKCTQYYRRTT